MYVLQQYWVISAVFARRCRFRARLSLRHYVSSYRAIRRKCRSKQMNTDQNRVNRSPYKDVLGSVNRKGWNRRVGYQGLRFTHVWVLSQRMYTGARKGGGGSEHAHRISHFILECLSSMTINHRYNRDRIAIHLLKMTCIFQ